MTVLPSVNLGGFRISVWRVLNVLHGARLRVGKALYGKASRVNCMDVDVLVNRIPSGRR